MTNTLSLSFDLLDGPATSSSEVVKAGILLRYRWFKARWIGDVGGRGPRRASKVGKASFGESDSCCGARSAEMGRGIGVGLAEWVIVLCNGRKEEGELGD